MEQLKEFLVVVAVGVPVASVTGCVVFWVVQRVYDWFWERCL